MEVSWRSDRWPAPEASPSRKISERFPLPAAFPVCHQFGASPINPRSYYTHCRRRKRAADDLATFDRHQRFETLIINVHVRWRVLAPVHLDDKAEEDGDRRHELLLSHAGGIGRGLPLSSMATKVKLASVTFSWICVWKRRAQASTWIFIEVRPVLSTAV